MRIEFQYVIPNFLGAAAIKASEVWNTEFAAQSPERIVLWGPSGQGKSTFLRILFGLEDDFSGSFFFDGETINPPAYRQWPSLRSERLSLVPQDFRLFEESSGWQNLALVPQWAPGIDQERIADWADGIGIGPLLDRNPSTWSKGQQQRFALLRALVSPFQWLLLDEPFSHLDPESAESALDLLSSVCADRKAGWILTQQTAETPLHPDQIFRV